MEKTENLVKTSLRTLLLVPALIFFLLTILAISLKALHFTVLGMSSLVLLICLSLLLKPTNKQKTLISVSLLCLSPYTWLLPIKGSHNPNGLLTSEFMGTPSTPWIQGIPESELLSIGEQLGYTKAEKESLKNVGTLAAQYPTIETSNLFKEDHTVLLDSWFIDRKHYWYLEGEQDAPLLIFLHGSGGNFKAYQHWFTHQAKLRDLNMAFPTWGAGIWSPEKLKLRIKKLITHLNKNKQFNKQQLFICGLSKGSMTSLKALASGDLDIAGFISISGVTNLQREEISTLTKVPIYFIHGTQDERSSFERCKNLFESLNKNKNSKLNTYSGNHTIIKVHTENIIKDIFDWIESISTL